MNPNQSQLDRYAQEAKEQFITLSHQVHGKVYPNLYVREIYKFFWKKTLF